VIAMLGEQQRHEALGVGLIALGLLAGLAILSPLLTGDERNLIGPAGALIHRWGRAAFGAAAALVAIPMIAWGVGFLGLFDRGRVLRWTLLSVGILVLIPSATWLLTAGETPAGESTGWVGRTLGAVLGTGFGSVGALLILAALLLVLVVLTLGLSPLQVASGSGRWAKRGLALGTGVARSLGRAVMDLYREPEREATVSPWEGVEQEAPQEEELEELPDLTRRNGGSAPPGGEEGTLADPGDLDLTALPPIDLLTEPVRQGSGLESRELSALGRVVVEKLATFRIDGEIGGWTTGPVVTQFEVVPAPGVKVGQIAARADDLALALRAPSIRIVAPIPGKGAVGVEVPNPEPEIVFLREVLESPAYRRSRATLPLALGRDLSGRPTCADLTRMPHLLIAGATGTGKSICMNSIITSLVYRYTPRELRLLMIDPKMVELSVYGELPHLRHPVITDNDDAASVLKWAVYEMKRRFNLLSANACRNVAEFNRRISDGRDVRRPGGSAWDEEEDRPYEDGELPYIVLLIDELADLIMTVQAEVETPLAMLAQKARAVGVHLVVATQRPSVNVLTGLIKANFPSRIAFRVASKTDSRTILDQNGAESLLGNGDLLFLPPGESDPIRIQGTYVSSEETERLLDWYRAQAAARALEAESEPDILEVVRELEEQDSGATAGEVLEERDELFRQAAEIVVANSSGSTSLLQRRLKIGYGRAARIIDQLHHAGVVGPADGSRAREILVALPELDDLLSDV
jgi:S-DNA-T family DNA segregation ATPase FtsK/SpoIIIE